MSDLTKRLRDGNLTVSGRAMDINHLLNLHNLAADEIDRLREIVRLVNRGSRMAMPPYLVAALDALSESDTPREQS